MKRVLIVLLACLILVGCAAPEATQPPEPTATPQPTPEPTPEPEGLLKEFGKDEVVALLYGDSEAVSGQILLQAQTELESMGVTCEILYKDAQVNGFDVAVVHTLKDESQIVQMCSDEGIPVAVISPAINSVEGVSTISYIEVDAYTQLMEAVMEYEHHTTPVRMIGVFSEADSEAALTYASYISQGKVMDKETIILADYEVEIPVEEVIEEEASEEAPEDEEMAEDENSDESVDTDETQQQDEDGAEDEEQQEGEESEEATDEQIDGEAEDIPVKDPGFIIYPQHYEELTLEMSELLSSSYFEGMLDAIFVEDEQMVIAVGTAFDALGRSDIEIVSKGTSTIIIDKMKENPELYAYEFVVDLAHAGTHAARLALIDLRDGITADILLDQSLYYAEQIEADVQSDTSEYNEVWMDELRVWSAQNG